MDASIQMVKKAEDRFRLADGVDSNIATWMTSVGGASKSQLKNAKKEYAEFLVSNESLEKPMQSGGGRRFRIEAGDSG